MNEPIVIRGARHWKTGRSIDVACAGGRVVDAAPAGARVIDAEGAVLAPGFVDVHVHLREPGQSAKETIETGTRAAAAGGFTDVLAMPNTSPVVDTVAGVQWVIARGRESLWARVHPIAAVTLGQKGETLTEMVALAAAGAVAFSDDGRPVRSAETMRRALEYARPTGRPVIAHEEDPDLKGDGHMNEGAVATRLGIRGIPAAAEAVMVRRDVELAELTRGRLHLAHLSCASSLDALCDAKRRGLAVTGETCPHYWMLDDRAVEALGTNAKMNPPLRSEADRHAVIRAIADGTIDCLATDHAPHTDIEKDDDFESAPFGIVGLETALGCYLKALVEPGHLTLMELIERMTVGPYRVLGRPGGTLEAGAEADVTVFDPESRSTVRASEFESKGRNTPFDGWDLPGRVLLTVVGGRIAYQAATSEATLQ